MRILFYLGHPAHFHLFKFVFRRLQDDKVNLKILIKEKDVLRHLLDHSEFEYDNILSEGKSKGKIGLLKDFLKRGHRMITKCRRSKPDLLIGTSPEISYVGKFLGIPAVHVIEDDASVIPLYARSSYPWATMILSPDCCSNGKWDKKTRKYPGYHELAYLHPDLFEPDESIVSNYISMDEPLIILRFVNHNAYHDRSGLGIDDSLASELIDSLKPNARILISSERPLNPSLEPYRLAIDPADIHHFLAYAKVVISDSQTMSAEAAVLGTPYIRFNDFVGKIGYLNELEDKYQLGFGFHPEEKGKMFQKVLELTSDPNTGETFQQRRQKMLNEKINVADFLYEFISQKKWAQS